MYRRVAAEPCWRIETQTCFLPGLLPRREAIAPILDQEALGSVGVVSEVTDDFQTGVDQ